MSPFRCPECKQIIAHCCSATGDTYLEYVDCEKLFARIAELEAENAELLKSRNEHKRYLDRAMRCMIGLFDDPTVKRVATELWDKAMSAPDKWDKPEVQP